MEHSARSPLLEISPGVVDRTRRLYGLDSPARREESLDLFEKWMQKQTHFIKRDFSRIYLEKTLIQCKGSMEKAKKQLDNLCTVKSVLPKFFTKTHIIEDFKHLSILSCVPLPKPTQDDYRVIVFKVNVKQLESHYFMECYQYFNILCEYMKRYDFVNGFIIVDDFRGENIVDVITKINTVEFQQYARILIECYGARLKGIYLLSDSKAVELLVKLAKQVTSAKISGRVRVVNDIEALHTLIPKDILPEDLGGNERSIASLRKDWLEVLSSDDHVAYMKVMREAATDESLRQSEKFNEDYLGMPGSFRHLSVD